MEGLTKPGKASQAPEPTSTTLELLASVEANRHLSQRSLATRLGIAVGLANGYLRRCVRKGWVKMSKAPARRYAYYLTPKGFAEKSRLTAEYLTLSFDFFRNARNECQRAFRAAEARGWRRIVLYGAGELAEIATLAARELDVELVAILAPGRNERELAGLPVVADLEDVGAFDAVLVTDIQTPQQSFDALRARIETGRVLTPPLLHVSREQASGETEAAE
ncbi:MAG: winged helix-turn-helix transcriptional regulator [Alphaproteobacteria bacterium]|nr:winged helix-turn-helix transcriptional regulator [Alphaproteobacteria bacterium]